MSRFFRVCILHPAAATPDKNGHPLYVWPRQGAGRVDDPLGQYRVLYAADTAAAAVAEALGHFTEWSRVVLDPPPRAPAGSVKALVEYEGDPSVCDLDDAHRLVKVGLRPSGVVTRDRMTTQGWARRLYERRTPEGDREFSGVSWWSYYNPEWASAGLWDVEGLSVVASQELTLDHEAVSEAASQLLRPVLAGRSGDRRRRPGNLAKRPRGGTAAAEG
ncbi:MAG: RES domain-containing protein [Actinomycetota bacterium]|nr:RES domain-containing protein [Actinomycetota bacterium]